ncbi:MAG: FtsW/RodA/SpoVE family cell cycle protein [Anaerolineaceae bacterium]|nr:FtsW/RodA/SpoVE family cell cycle protein [Anaerolineaceae bacterium]
MNWLFPSSSAWADQIQSRLLKLSAVFLVLNALVLTLSPAVRYHSWQAEYRWQHWLGVLIWLASFSLVHRLVMQALPERDPFLLPLAALLTGWGLLSIWRLSTENGLRQSLWMVFSLLILVLGLRAKNLLGVLKRYKYIWLISGILISALTFIFGTYPGGEGPRLWLGCCGLYFQPSEPLKLLLIIYLAAYLADKILVNPNFLQLLLPTFLLVGAALGILLIQRDLGTASLFLLLYFTIIFLASGRIEVLAVGAVSLLAAGITGYAAFDVIRLRVEAWLNPWLDPSGRSYQIVQSLIAISSGQILGRGAGIGYPGFVPIAHSDFIFSSIGEEYGLAGTLALLAILALWISRGFRVAVMASNRYKRFLAAGSAAYIGLQSIFIIGGNIRLLPLTGVTLPFVSYGGSSLVTSYFTLLLLMLISVRSETPPAPLQNTRPYLITGGMLFISLLSAGMVNGWWSVIRSNDLMGRFDNPRRSAVSQVVLRGAILDRNNQPIVISTGKPGDYTRHNLYPPLSLVTGYTSIVYGQTGLEASLDPYLRGLQGSPTSTVWSSQFLYGQPPPGLDVRLSIDLKLQTLADSLLGNYTGAIVIINAQSGEVLAMASHPYFDSNQIHENMGEWLQSDRGYLLNRATQASYPPGTALGAFILTDYLAGQPLPDSPPELSIRFNNQNWNCAVTPSDPLSWGEVISSGCPGPILELGKQLGAERLAGMYEDLGLTQSPSLRLPVAKSVSTNDLTDTLKIALGQDAITISPLQMVLASASLSREGGRPAPFLALAVSTPQQGWVILPNDATAPALPVVGIPQALQLLENPALPVWESTASAFSGEGRVAWYTGGTMPDWKGTPISLVVTLENQNPVAAMEIGHSLFKTILRPK